MLFQQHSNMNNALKIFLPALGVSFSTKWVLFTCTPLIRMCTVHFCVLSTQGFTNVPLVIVISYNTVTYLWPSNVILNLDFEKMTAHWMNILWPWRFPGVRQKIIILFIFNMYQQVLYYVQHEKVIGVLFITLIYPKIISISRTKNTPYRTILIFLLVGTRTGSLEFKLFV